MTLRQQLIDDRVESLSALLNIPKDQAFERLVHSIITGQSVHTLDPADWVDGGQDKQIDLISMEEDDNEAELFIISAKFTSTFSSNAIILMGNGLNWMFKRPKLEIATISNEPFRDKILEVRSTMQALGWSNVAVRCFFITNAIGGDFSDEFKQEKSRITAEYDNGSFAEFSFEALGADDLVMHLNRLERRNRSIDADIPIKYDANSPSLIRYDSQGLKGIVCTASAMDVAELVIRDPLGALFDANVRRFLGKGKAVNADILKTACDPDSSYLFWFLNNGITIVCDSCDPVTDPDHPVVKIKNLQIVNGCQTATALAHAARDSALRPDTRVLLKVFQTTEPSLASKVVLTTNNQNKISSRDLKANDPIQEDMRRGFERYGLLYEHKVNQYDTIKVPVGKRIVSNEDVGQAYLAIALRKPGDGRRRKYKVWEDHYTDIFCGGHVQPYVICLLIFEAATNWARGVRKHNGLSDLERKLVNTGLFHIARAAAFLWRNTDSFKEASNILEDQIKELCEKSMLLHPHFDAALTLIANLITANPAFHIDVDTALKSSLLETSLTAALHQPNRHTLPAQGILTLGV